MDCVKFWTLMSACGFILFLSLFFIVKYQSQFYRYGIKDQGSSETAVLVATIFYLLMFIAFLIWGNRRDKARREGLLYNNLPAGSDAQVPGFFDEKRNVSIEQEEKQME